VAIEIHIQRPLLFSSQTLELYCMKLKSMGINTQSTMDENKIINVNKTSNAQGFVLSLVMSIATFEENLALQVVVS
jgi:hypothetical protein